MSSANQTQTQTIAVPAGFACKAQPKLDLSMLKGDVDEIDMSTIERDLGEDLKNTAWQEEQRHQFLEMVKNPPPAKLLIKMLWDVTHKFVADNRRFGYDDDEGEFCFKPEKDWFLMKVKRQVEDGEHDDAIRDWVLNYIYYKEELPDDLELD